MTTNLRRLTVILALSLVAITSLVAQRITGEVCDKELGIPLAGVRVSVQKPKLSTLVYTDKKGQFSIQLPAATQYQLSFKQEGYVDYTRSFTQEELQSSSFKINILLKRDLSKQKLEEIDDAFAAFVVEENADDAGTGQSPVLLSASRDPYINKAGFQFSPVRFRIRGYDSPYQEQLLNGMQMNNLNNGYSAWSLWNGLNNVTIDRLSVEGVGYAPFTFGSVGGAVNILTRPSSFSKGGRLTYSLSNRSYNHRAMVYYSTGLMPNGWAITLMGSKRFGNHGYALGQFYDAYGYFLGIEKRLNSHHSLMLYALASPTERGVASASTQEAYNLAGSNFYNPNVGLQNGKWRNARVRNSHEPIIQLLHEYKAPRLTLTTGVGYRFGFNGYSALNWHNAPDPRPDYYRYLPSYYSYMTERPDPFLEDYYREAWASDPNVRYINWERLYQINQSNYTKVYSSDGKLLAEGRRSEYVLEDRRNDQQQINASSVANIALKEGMKLDLGANYRYNVTQNFNVIKDLLGGDFWYDIDKFSERDFPNDPSKAQLDLNNPDRIVKEGDTYSHNFVSSTQVAKLWSNYSFESRYVDGYASIEGSWTQIYREGKQKRGLFPENSFGKSDLLHFIDYGAKLGITTKLSGRHFIVLNGALLTKAPYFNDLFISPRINNFYIDNPRSEMIASGDISYILRHPSLKGRVTLFYSRFMHGSRKRSFYDDAYRAFSNIVLTNIDREHMGVELGLEAKLLPSLTATLVFTYANYAYANNPDYIQTVDNNRALLEGDRVYWKGFHVAGTPQTAANLSFNYQTPFYMYLGVDFNYFDRNYIDLNPKLRTDAARDQLDPQYIHQEKFPAAFTMDANVGYSWRIKSGHFLRFNLSVTNILNNKGVKSGGYEQSRVRQTIDGKMMRPFDSRYYYMLGTNFFLNVSYVF